MPAFSSPRLRLSKACFGDMNRRLVRCDRMDCEKALRRLTPQPNDLPLRSEPTGQAIKRNIVDFKREQLFVQFFGELILITTPFRREPFFRYEEEHRLAAGGRIFECVGPTLAGSNATLGIEIQKDIVRPAPAFADEPILQRDRPVVVLARMADK